jgi:hypothetical protein
MKEITLVLQRLTLIKLTEYQLHTTLMRKYKIKKKKSKTISVSGPEGP